MKIVSKLLMLFTFTMNRGNIFIGEKYLHQYFPIFFTCANPL